MKKKYIREAYYLDNGILIHGHKDKRGFHPEKGLSCGFDVQRLTKKSKKNHLFYSIRDAVAKLGEVEIAGGDFYFCIDDGMAQTKVIFQIDKEMKYYTTNTLVTDTGVDAVIVECLRSVGVTALYQGNIRHDLASTLPRWTPFCIDANSRRDTGPLIVDFTREKPQDAN